MDRCRAPRERSCGRESANARLLTFRKRDLTRGPEAPADGSVLALLTCGLLECDRFETLRHSPHESVCGIDPTTSAVTSANPCLDHNAERRQKRCKVNLALARPIG